MSVLDDLFDAARDVRSRAYAPYSRFAVGAALLAEDGDIYSGANVENAAYPEGMCAEASAIAAMIAGNARRIREIVVLGDGNGLCAPCGGCRQKIREFATSDTTVHIADSNGIKASFNISDLLPSSFGPDTLKES